MKLCDQVISLELAKRLKELGVKQESLYVWSASTVPETLWNVGALDEAYSGNFSTYAAFTVAELGEKLPSYDCGITASTPDNPPEGYLDGIELVHLHENGKWITKVGESYYDASAEEYPRFENKTEAEARGLMLAYLIENGFYSTK